MSKPLVTFFSSEIISILADIIDSGVQHTVTPTRHNGVKQLPVSPEKLVALFESVVEQHVDALQGHLSIIYVLCPHLYLLLLLLGLLGTRHCLYCSSDQCDGEQNVNLFVL